MYNVKEIGDMIFHAVWASYTNIAIRMIILAYDMIIKDGECH